MIKSLEIKSKSASFIAFISSSVSINIFSSTAFKNLILSMHLKTRAFYSNLFRLIYFFIPQNKSRIFCASLDKTPSCKIRYCTAIKVHSEQMLTSGPFTILGTSVFGRLQKLQYSIFSVFFSCFGFLPKERTLFSLSDTSFCPLAVSQFFNLK